MTDRWDAALARARAVTEAAHLAMSEKVRARHARTPGPNRPPTDPNLEWCTLCAGWLPRPHHHYRPEEQMSEVKVLAVPEGSIIWLHDIEVPEGERDALVDRLYTGIGHDRFVMLCTSGGGIVDIVGPDELVDRVRATLDGVVPVATRACRFCGCTDDRGCDVPGGCYWLELDEYGYDVCSACAHYAEQTVDATDRGANVVHADTLVDEARAQYDAVDHELGWDDLPPAERRHRLTHTLDQARLDRGQV